TGAGSLAGGITAQGLSEETVGRLFAAVMAIIAVMMLRTLNRRDTPVGVSASPEFLGGTYDDLESGGKVTYQVRRLPVALIASFIAGNVSSLLGIGGGVI